MPGVSVAAEKGLETDLTWGTSSADQTKTAGLLPSMGSKWVRLTLDWKDVETANNSYSSSALSMYDHAVSLARAAGQKVLVTVYTTPKWASSTGDVNAPPSSNAYYAEFMSFLANRYRGQVNAWEIWNEENTTRFWSSGPNAAQYAGLLKAAYPAVKAADPSATVVFGGTFSNDYSFVEGAYAAGAKGSFDAMATHPYTGSVSPDAMLSWNGRLAPAAFAGYREVRNSMLANGDDKPIWLTEFGWSTTSQANGVSAAQQASYLTAAYCVAQQDPYVTVAIWYEFRNNFWANNADTMEDQYGLMNTSFVPKPSYYAFQSYTPGATNCPSTTATPSAQPSAPAPSASTTTAPAARATTMPTATRRPTTVVLRVVRVSARGAKSAQARKTRLLVTGTVRGVSSGRVALTLERAGRPSGWKSSGAPTGQISRTGSFRVSLVAAPGRWRARALFRGNSTTLPSSSRLTFFTV